MSKVLVFGKQDSLPKFQQKAGSNIKQLIGFKKDFDIGNPDIEASLMNDQAILNKNQKHSDQLDGPKQKKLVFKTINCTSSFTQLEEVSGELYIFGENINNCFGYQGLKNFAKLNNVVQFGNIRKTRIKSFCKSDDHNMFINTDDKIFGWGYNKFSQMNAGSFSYHDRIQYFPIQFLRTRNSDMFELYKKETALTNNAVSSRVNHLASIDNIIDSDTNLTKAKKNDNISEVDQHIEYANTEKPISADSNTDNERGLHLKTSPDKKKPDPNFFKINLQDNSFSTNTKDNRADLKDDIDQDIKNLSNKNIFSNPNSKLNINLQKKTPKNNLKSNRIITAEHTINNLIPKNQNSCNIKHVDNSLKLPKSINPTPRNNLYVNKEDLLSPQKARNNLLKDLISKSKRCILNEDMPVAKPSFQQMSESQPENGFSGINSKIGTIVKKRLKPVVQLSKTARNKNNSSNSTILPHMSFLSKKATNKKTVQNKNDTTSRSNITERNLPMLDHDKSANFYKKNIDPTVSKKTPILAQILQSFIPKVEENPEGIHMISCNNSCTYFVTKKGCFSIGNKESGLLGFENTGLQLNHPVPIDLSFTIQLIGISANDNHVLVWDNHGKLYSWGYNSCSQLGLLGNAFEDKESQLIRKPTEVNVIGDKKVVSALAGVYSTYIITSKSKVYFWGQPIRFLDNKGKIFENPQLLETSHQLENNSDEEPIKIVKIISLQFDYAAQDTLGRVYVWGTNYYDNLGFKYKDPDFKNYEPNPQVNLNKKYIAFDIGLNKKNLVTICFIRNYDTENLFKTTPLIKNYFDNIRLFQKKDMYRQKNIKSEQKEHLLYKNFKGQGKKNYFNAENSEHINIEDHRQFASQSSLKTNYNKDNELYSKHDYSTITANQSSIINNRGISKIEQNYENSIMSEIDAQKSSRIFTKKNGLYQLPLLPSIRDKFIAMNDACSNNNSKISNKNKILDDTQKTEQLCVKNYREFLGKEIKKNKAQQYVELDKEENSHAGLNFEFLQFNKDNNSFNEAYIKETFTNKIQQEVFGEFEVPVVDENKLDVKRSIESCQKSDLRKIFMRAIKNSKETDVFGYIFTGIEALPDKVVSKEKIFTGVLDKICKTTNDLYKKGVKFNRKGVTLTNNVQEISDHLLLSLKKAVDINYRKKNIDYFTNQRKNELNYCNRMKTGQKKNLVSMKDQHGTIPENSENTDKKPLVKNALALSLLKLQKKVCLTKEEKILKAVEKGALLSAKTMQYTANKDKINKGYLQDMKSIQADKCKKYEKRIQLTQKRRFWTKVTKGFLSLFLQVRTCRELKRIVIFHKSKKNRMLLVDKRIIRIQRYIKERFKPKDTTKIGCSTNLKSTVLRLGIKDFTRTILQNRFFDKIKFRVVLIRHAVTKIQRFALKKLNNVYFEKTILAIQLNKIFMRCFGKSPVQKALEIHEKSLRGFSNNKDYNSLYTNKVAVNETENIKASENSFVLSDIFKIIDKILVENYSANEVPIENLELISMFKVFDLKTKFVEELQKKVVWIIKHDNHTQKLVSNAKIFWKEIFKIITKDFLPFIDERYNLEKKFLLDIGLMPDNYFIEVMKNFEIKAKFKFIESVYKYKMVTYLKDVKEYIIDLTEFSEKNIDGVDKLRSFEMLKVGSKRLREIFAQEKMNVKISGFLNNQRTMRERDYQPFQNKILKFAEKLENAPVKPNYNLFQNPKQFEKCLQDYTTTLKKQAVVAKTLVKQHNENKLEQLQEK